MPPYRIDWLDEAAADVRSLDRETAMRLFEGIRRFALTGAGDVSNTARRYGRIVPASFR